MPTLVLENIPVPLFERIQGLAAARQRMPAATAYAVGHVRTAYVEPLAVGDPLIAMPLFLTRERYVPVPLEETYQATYQGVPRRWRTVLERTGT